MKKLVILTLTSLLLASSAALYAAEPASPVPGAPGIYDIRTFGAVGDGATLNTQALQTAIDTCSTAGGGTVLVAGGRFVTGTFHLKDNVCLRVDSGAAILGSTNIADYTTDTDRTMYREPHMNRCLIFAQDAHNISIEGMGTIDGRGKSFPQRGDLQKNRPKLMRLLNCSRLRVRDITWLNPASWTTEWRYCSDIAVDGITISSRANGNGDGLDFDGCTNVRVSNSTFDNSDDSICLQTSLADKPCRDIVISNCHFSSYWAGMRIGLLSRGNFENVTVTNCTFRDHKDSGIKIQMNEGGEIKNMIFTNLVMQNVPRPVFLTFCQKRAWVDAPQELAPMKSVRGLQLSNITVDSDTGTKDAAFVFVGLPGHPVEDISLTNIRATFAGGGTEADAANKVNELTPENLKGWPEYGSLGKTVPAHGLFARHVKGITMRNVKFSTKTPDARPAVVFEDVTDADVEPK